MIMKSKSSDALALCARVFAICGVGRGAAANENPPDRIPNWCLRFPLPRPAPRHSARVCASLGMWRGKTLSLSGDLQRENSIASCACGRASASQGRHHRHGGPVATRAAKEATSTIPIVMTQDGDPVGSGFVASLARPGGNITGLSTLAPELSGKRLELLKEIIPKLSRVAVFGTSTSPDNAQSVKRNGARRKGVRSEASIPRRTKSQGY